mmetsp:Transcript_4047/g.18096  ORF Transcript_4047/g.18096 Transcript_4047/m.18096 type:complete len:415 (-) Transcript_4047:634-1878(-)
MSRQPPFLSLLLYQWSLLPRLLPAGLRQPLLFLQVVAHVDVWDEHKRQRHRHQRKAHPAHHDEPRQVTEVALPALNVCLDPRSLHREHAERARQRAAKVAEAREDGKRRGLHVLWAHLADEHRARHERHHQHDGLQDRIPDQIEPPIGDAPPQVPSHHHREIPQARRARDQRAYNQRRSHPKFGQVHVEQVNTQRVEHLRDHRSVHREEQVVKVRPTGVARLVHREPVLHRAAEAHRHRVGEEQEKRRLGQPLFHEEEHRYRQHRRHTQGHPELNVHILRRQLRHRERHGKAAHEGSHQEHVPVLREQVKIQFRSRQLDLWEESEEGSEHRLQRERQRAPKHDVVLLRLQHEERYRGRQQPAPRNRQPHERHDVAASLRHPRHGLRVLTLRQQINHAHLQVDQHHRRDVRQRRG